ncbi:MAG: hypothetical protein LQ348_007341 [Seirophora lacunosa]|nr:MAG: hypothetical protein LQ348_007341 [Seirophora lacunosa]
MPTKTIKTTKTLLSLPPELHLHLTAHLPLSSRLALALTNTHFRRLMHQHAGIDTVRAFAPLIAGLPGTPQTQTPTTTTAAAVGGMPELERERQLFLSYVERDHLLLAAAAQRAKGKGSSLTTRLLLFSVGNEKKKGEREREILYCAYCQDYHPAGMFTAKMRSAWRHERACAGAEGKLWLCPHRQIDHRDVRDFTCLVRGPACGDASHDIVVDLDGVTVVRPVLVLGKGKRKPRYGAIKQAMKGRRVRICPHLGMSQREVYTAAMAVAAGEKEWLEVGWEGWVDRRLGKTEGKVVHLLDRVKGWRSTAEERQQHDGRVFRKGKRRCSKCDTSWEFMVGLSTVRLVVYKPFVHSHGVCHPTWHRQVALPEEFEELEREWDVDAKRFEKNPRLCPGTLSKLW